MSNDEETMQGLDGSAFAANLFVENSLYAMFAVIMVVVAAVCQ